MKRLILLVLVGFLLAQCSTGERPRDKFLGSWKATEKRSGKVVNSFIREHDKKDMFIWTIEGRDTRMRMKFDDENEALIDQIGVLGAASKNASLTYTKGDTIHASLSQWFLFKEIFSGDYIMVKH